ncbi:hypothetical protein DSL72_002827 [Monilinia vaccinii-corymbosi]|uniref:Uncharacterized protein n=1 Tax=Monilinia vaccinii-corymbosi TaxID=61207 RepID=A0A8A3PDT1_9HELO|nr:hypothetical protein DSL72_002827 [Monilinia vaccinii-corymbosi]
MPTHVNNDSNNSTPSITKESSSGSTKKQRQQKSAAHTYTMLTAKKAKDKAPVEDDFSLGHKENFDSKGEDLDEKGLPIDPTARIRVLKANLQALRAAESTRRGPEQVHHQQQQQQQKRVDSEGSLRVVQTSRQESEDNIFESPGRRLFGSPAKRQFEAEDCREDLEGICVDCIQSCLAGNSEGICFLVPEQRNDVYLLCFKQRQKCEKVPKGPLLRDFLRYREALMMYSVEAEASYFLSRSRVPSY